MHEPINKDIYTDFAPVYDYLLRHVDYDRWYRYIRAMMKRYVPKADKILELGCGTGRFGAKFSRDNFTIFGMDLSMDMLRVARVRSYRNFRIFCGDMRDFRLNTRFDFIFSVHDTMNYFLTYGDITKILQSTKRVLSDRGVFMFDITTEYNIRKFFNNRVKQFETRDNIVEWSNRYDERRKIIYSSLIFHKPDGTSSREEHIQRIYSVDEISSLLRKARYEIIDIFSDYSFSGVRADTVMINFVTRKA